MIQIAIILLCLVLSLIIFILLGITNQLIKMGKAVNADGNLLRMVAGAVIKRMNDKKSKIVQLNHVI